MFTNRIVELILTLSASLAIIALACGGDEPAESTPVPAAQAEAPAAPSPSDRAALHGAPPGVELPKLIGPKQYDGPPPMLIDPSKKHTAYIEMEQEWKGKEIAIELFADKAPRTVNNFVFLARDGFYDGLTFYQVSLLGDARTGDPTNTGTGGPGYFIDDEIHPDLCHKFRMVTMGNDDKPNTSGSRFRLITIGVAWGEPETCENSSTESLNGFNIDGSLRDCADPEATCHSVFGRVIGGEAGPSVSRMSFIQARNSETATTPGEIIKTVRIEVGE